MGSEDEERRLWFRNDVLPLEPALHVYAKRFCRDRPDEADDLVQDTFAKLIGYAGWRAIDNVSAFALRTLKNQALYLARRQQIVPIHLTADLETLGVADDMPGIDRVIDAREELRLLTQLIGTLPPQCRRVFTLRKIYGLSNTEIAEKLSLSVSTVEKHLIKGLRLCSKGLARAPSRDSEPPAGRSEAVRCSESG